MIELLALTARRVGRAGVVMAPLFAIAAAAGLEGPRVIGLAFVAGGICGALLAPAAAVDHRARLAPIYPWAGLTALGLAVLVLVAVAWLVLEAAGPAVAVGVLVAGAAAIAYVAGAAFGAWLVTGRLQARRRGAEEAELPR